ncbi:MAG: hypothetical protein JXA99_14170 [Candidatus Lokiarchaeota archaeon]|nr:hypothetical protein [Candidatus Lokiarchaeota archaeon]
MNRVNYEDLILDLYLLNKLEKGGGRKRVAKFIFLLEEDMLLKKSIGPHYNMIKCQMGPYNQKFQRNLDNLAENTYIKYSNRYYKNETTGVFLKQIDDLIQENSNLFNIFDNIIDEFQGFNGDDLAKYIYDLPHIGIKRQSFYEYEEFESIIDPRNISNPKYKFELDEDWYDTVEILLNPKILQNIQKGIKDCITANFVQL